MNVERLNELAAAIEGHKLPEVGFNMNYWHMEMSPDYPVPDYSSHNCGTVACIGGWADLLYSDKSPEYTLTKETAANLGLDEKQANALFFSYSIVRKQDITPAEAAKVIRNLAATGEVDWTILNGERV